MLLFSSKVTPLRFYILFSIALGSISSKSFAFPVLVHGSDLKSLVGLKREKFIAFRIKPDQTGEKIPLQFDEIEDDSAIVFRKPNAILPARKIHPHPSKIDPFRGSFEEVHRISMNDQDFLACDAKCEQKAPEIAKSLCGQNAQGSIDLSKIELKFLKTSAFVAVCSTKQAEQEQLPVTVDFKNRTFSTPSYSYTFKDKKNILFENIAIPAGGEKLFSNSELMVYLKPKYVFNLQFSEKDLVSRVTSVSQGPVSTGVEIAFALDVLSFKVNSQICCDMSLYKDSFYFPVMIDLPFEGSSFKKGSGLFYGLNAQIDPLKDLKSMAPPMSDYVFQDDPKPSEGASSAMLITSGDKMVAVGFQSMKKTEGKPSVAPLLAKPADLKKIEFPVTKSDFGLFYDITTLAKGFHHFNVWFYVGNKSQEEMLSDYAKNGVEFSVKQL
jgi:hypothetical protein